MNATHGKPIRRGLLVLLAGLLGITAISSAQPIEIPTVGIGHDKLFPIGPFQIGEDIYANTAKGLAYVDVSDETNPQFRGFCPEGSCTYAIAQFGDTLVTKLGDSVLKFVDVTNRDQLEYLGSVDFNADFSGFSLRGRQYFTLVNGDIHVYDLQDPLNPSLIGSYDANIQIGYLPLNMQLIGDALFISRDRASLMDTLFVYDVSDVQNISMMGTAEFDGEAISTYDDMLVSQSSNHPGGLDSMYVRFHSVDDPLNPVLVKEISVVSDGVGRFTVVDQFMLLRTVSYGQNYDAHEGSRLFLMEDVNTIEPLHSLSGRSCMTINGQGEHIYVNVTGTDFYDPNMNTMRTIPVSNEGVIGDENLFDYSSGGARLADAYEDEFAIVAFDEELSILDIQDPENMHTVGDPIDMGRRVNNMYVVGTDVYVYSCELLDQYPWTDYSVSIRRVSLSNLMEPTFSTVYNRIDYGVYAETFSVGQDYIILPWDDRYLRVMSTVDPDETEMNTYYVGDGFDHLGTVASFGEFAYVEASEYGVYLLQISDPPNVTELGFYEEDREIRSMATGDGFVVIGHTEGFDVVDVTTPDNPVVVYSDNTIGMPYTIRQDDGYVYLRSSVDNRLYAYDMHDPANPEWIGWSDDAIGTFQVHNGMIYNPTYHDFRLLDARAVVGVEESDRDPDPAVDPEVSVSPDLPGTFRLAPVYPNPFNGQATITVDLPRATNLDVIVSNLLGRRMATVAAGGFPAGQHQFTLDATGWASGSYLVNAASSDGAGVTRRITLVK